MTDQTRNLIILAVVGIAILIGWQYLFPQVQPTTPPPSEAWSEAASEAASATQTDQPVFIPVTREEALSKSARVTIEAPRVYGSISLTGARIDDVELRDYKRENEPGSPDISLLIPSGTESSYFTEFGWTSSEGVKGILPDASTVWQANRGTLTAENPVTLTWDNGQGLRFTRVISIDENFMFAIERRVENYGNNTIALWPYALIARYGTGVMGTIPYATYLVHEGAIGVFNEILEEEDYDDMREEKKIEFASTGGWAGITDKYWLVALIPDQTRHFEAEFTHATRGEADKYQVGMIDTEAMQLNPGGSIEVTDHLFAGAKQYNLLEDYEDVYAIPSFDKAVKFFLLWFISKPLFYALDFFNRGIGNFGIAILLLTICVRLLLFPLANKSYKAMSKMKKLAPKITKMRERYKDDKPRINKEMMELYKKEKVNPMAGCLPVLLQIPIFFALYNVLFVSIEMRHAPFFGWISDLSAPDPYSIFTLFGLLDYRMLFGFDLPMYLNVGPWPILMGLSMYLQFKLNPTPPEPIQAKIMMFLPLVFTFILAPFPAGLVIYWTWNNILSITQQWFIMHRMGVKVSFGGKKT
jgi:YidC/Oxa1 family membrane protein insertase